MRKIKFRAWDGEKMIGCDSVKYFVEFDGTVWENNGNNESDLLEQREMTLMQFTGLKDKNGTQEVYESDRISFKFKNAKGEVAEYAGIVLMDEYMWCVETPEGEIFSINRIHHVEIIGNKYEN